jgi:hypothetical protein
LRIDRRGDDTPATCPRGYPDLHKFLRKMTSQNELIITSPLAQASRV